VIHQVKEAIKHRIEKLRKLQKPNGSWRFCFEGGPLTDAFTIMTLRALEDPDEHVIKKLTERIRGLQHSNGAWKKYKDEEEGNLTATVHAYNALLFSGFFQKTDENMKKAESFIKEHGGLANIHFMTKWMLAANGQYPWPTFFYMPMTFMLVPPSFPVNFFDLSSYLRIHFVPMMIVANIKFSIQSKWTPSLSHLFIRSASTDPNAWQDPFRKEYSFFKAIYQEMKQLAQLPAYWNRLGYQYAERYMLSRIEKDGTLMSYASATLFMIYALLALGYHKQSPIIKNAVSGVKSLIWKEKDMWHVENSTSTLWDTALISYALQEAGVSDQDPMVLKSLHYLQQRQHTAPADWSLHNPNVLPGGWGFSDINTNHPDNDDTSAALRAITRTSVKQSSYRLSWNRGTSWLLSMQNRDGGWAAFEKNTDKSFYALLPLENAEDAAIDPSTADITGRVLEFFGNYTGLKKNHPNIKKAVQWLLDHQEKDGSWFGRWGVCYIYGTWAALTGLSAVGLPAEHPAIQKAMNWLISIQNPDGGWGESCRSVEKKRFVPLDFSTFSQTAWAVDALIACSKTRISSIEKGIQFLIKPENQHAKSQTYPTGIGLPGQFYFRYHSYHEIFPLLTLAHYINKFNELEIKEY
jgi:sporulenol synthase